MNIPSMSARTGIGFSQKRKRTPSRPLGMSGPVYKLLFGDCPWKLEAAFATQQTLPGLLGFSTGRFGDTRFDPLVDLAFVVFFFKSAGRVLL